MGYHLLTRVRGLGSTSVSAATDYFILPAKASGAEQPVRFCTEVSLKGQYFLSPLLQKQFGNDEYITKDEITVQKLQMECHHFHFSPSACVPLLAS